MTDLKKKRCVPCEGGIPSLVRKEALAYLKKLPGWQLAKDSKSIYAEYVMKDFLAAIRLINAIAKVAEKEDHHPDLYLSGYRRLRVTLSTHAIRGLSLNDFILAAKITALPKDLKK